jgi:hypothetical protein
MSSIDRLIGSVPANKTAARVVGRGEHWEPNMSPTVVQYRDGPPKTVPPPSCNHDLTGTVVGRLTVRGYLAHGRWLVRCVCGIYEPRTTRAIKKSLSTMCSSCNDLERLKRIDHFNQTGRWPDQEAT